MEHLQGAGFRGERRNRKKEGGSDCARTTKKLGIWMNTVIS